MKDRGRDARDTTNSTMVLELESLLWPGVATMWLWRLLLNLLWLLHALASGTAK